MLLKVKNCKFNILWNVEASYGIMPLMVEINVALRTQEARHSFV